MRTYNLKIGGQDFEARILEYTESKVVVDLNGDTYEVELSPEEPIAKPPLVRSAPPEQPPKSVSQPESGTSQPSPQPAQSAPSSGASGPGGIAAPIPGVVKQILVGEGDTVSEGQVVMILEAMKMENEISARTAGTVQKIHVAVGASVQEDQPLIDIGEA